MWSMMLAMLLLILFQEEPVEGYGNLPKNNITATVRTPEVVEIPVTKVWKDNDSQDGVRPDKGHCSISLQMVQK